MLDKKLSQFHHFVRRGTLNDVLPLGGRRHQGVVYFKTGPGKSFGPRKIFMLGAVFYMMAKEWGLLTTPLFLHWSKDNRYKVDRQVAGGLCHPPSYSCGLLEGLALTPSRNATFCFGADGGVCHSDLLLCGAVGGVI